jgi:hypothetical protein
MSHTTHFAFNHKVFRVEGGYFSAPSREAGARFNIPMGEVMTSVPLETLRKEYRIPPDSVDGNLLTLVESALNHVKEIRVDDAIPTELLDGTASWSVEERHRTLAASRLARYLVQWATGKKERVRDLEEFTRRLESPALRKKLNDAFAKMTRHLGLGADGIAEVEAKIERLAQELAHLEALRERFEEIRSIEELLEGAVQLCGQSTLNPDEIARIRVLLSSAFLRIASQFELMDKQGARIAEALEQMDRHIELIRSVRNDTHHELMRWDGILEQWHDFSRQPSTPAALAAAKETYRFLAQNYPIMQVW